MGSCSVAGFRPFDRGDDLVRLDFGFRPFGNGGTRITSPVHFVAVGSAARAGLLSADVRVVDGDGNAPFAAKWSPSFFVALPADFGVAADTAFDAGAWTFWGTRDPTPSPPDDGRADAGRFDGDFPASDFEVADFDPPDLARVGFVGAGFVSVAFVRVDFFVTVVADATRSRVVSLGARSGDDFGRFAGFVFLARAIRRGISVTYCPTMGNKSQNAVLYGPMHALSRCRARQHCTPMRSFARRFSEPPRLRPTGGMPTDDGRRGGMSALEADMRSRQDVERAARFLGGVGLHFRTPI